MKELEPLEPPTRPKNRPRRGRWRAQLTRIYWYVDKIVQVEEAIEDVLKFPKFNAAGLAALLSRAKEFREDLERIRKEQPNELDGASRDELREYLGLQMEGWPDEHLEVAFLVYGQRHRGRMLWVGDGGHRSEWDPETGWERASEGD